MGLVTNSAATQITTMLTITPTGVGDSTEYLFFVSPLCSLRHLFFFNLILSRWSLHSFPLGFLVPCFFCPHQGSLDCIDIIYEFIDDNRCDLNYNHYRVCYLCYCDYYRSRSYANSIWCANLKDDSRSPLSSYPFHSKQLLYVS